jgi:S1-C subfamily serine protease
MSPTGCDPSPSRAFAASATRFRADRRPIEPLADLVDHVVGDARRACLVGGAAASLGAASLVLLRISRRFRALLPISLAAVGVLAGATAATIGAAEWYAAAQGFGWEHLAMPPLPDTAGDRVAERIMRATVVIMSPDAEGDARGAAIGAGSVIRTDAGRTWVATCSHVAMPYASASAQRDPSKSQTVWAYFADGRNAPGRVRWVGAPPLDVAVVSIDVADGPEPVIVSVSADTVARGDATTFVPNPFRSGWKANHGEVLRRETHETPAGRFNLLYTTLPVQPGDSGTGLFDAAGRLVGINTWVTSGESGPVGISLPSDVMERLVDFVAGKTPETPK